MINDSVKKLMDESVLCWLATSSKELQPNVSPKEVFTYHGEEIIIANIASPGSVQNIKQNPLVSVAFINLFTQKGYQCKGQAEIIHEKNTHFPEIKEKLVRITKGRFPFSEVIKISVSEIKEIKAPTYLFYPETTESELVNSAMKTYGVKPR